MPAFDTPNGVKVTFDNNIIRETRYGTPPLLVFDKDWNLLEVNFDGYEIRQLPREQHVD